LGIAERDLPESSLFSLQLGDVEGLPSTNGTAARPAAIETVAQLQHLAALHASGALTDAEFAAAKSGLIQ